MTKIDTYINENLKSLPVLFSDVIDIEIQKEIDEDLESKFYKALERKYARPISLYKATDIFREFAVEYNTKNKNSVINDILYCDSKRKIEKAKHTNMIDVTDYLNLKTYKDRCACPLCNSDNETTLKFTDNIFYCFKCLEKGDTINFVEKLKGYSFIEAVKFLNYL